MNKVFLPGLPINMISVFDLRVGNRVYDKASHTVGEIVMIKETHMECIEAFVKFEDNICIFRTDSLPHLIYLSKF